MATNIKEIWKPVVNFEGRYEVSNLGRVRSLLRGIVLSICSYKTGYKYVGLYGANGAKKKGKVHLLVLEAFIGPRPADGVARHLDGCKSNNAVANLRWGTVAENEADKRRHNSHYKGERVNTAKLTAGDIRRMRERAAKGEAGAALAREYGVSKQTACAAIAHKTWRHVV